jgi:hypothetical protein
MPPNPELSKCPFPYQYKDSTQAIRQLPHSSMNQGLSGMQSTDYTCLTCSGPILENTTSTTTCARCARLRIRRRNFAHQTSDQSYRDQQHPTQQQLQLPNEVMFVKSVDEHERLPHGRHDSRDSGVSSGSSQDYGECTPTAEKSLMFPRFPATSDRPTVPMSQLVRKLSEVEGPTQTKLAGHKISVDEGVITDIDDTTPHLSTTANSGAQKKASSFDTSSLGSMGPNRMGLARESGMERAAR